MEINSSYRRLDLKPSYARLAKDKGVKLIISTDAHHPDYLEDMIYGVATARRGWIEKKHIINTFSLNKFLKSLKKEYV